MRKELNDISYWTYHDDKSPSILMIHGFRGTHHGLESIAKNLPEYRTVIPDLPGFGESKELKGHHSLVNYVAAVRTIQKETIPSGQRIVVGHSFGSIVAAQYAATHPELVDKLILINPISAPALKGPKAAMTRLAIAYYWIGKKLPHRLSSKWLGSKVIVDTMSRQLTVSSDAELRQYIKDQHRRYFSTFASPRVVAEAFRTSVAHTVTDVAEKLTMPTLVIGATDDQISAVHTQAAFAKSLPNATYVELENVGHLTHYEQPITVAAAIREFLS